MKTFLRIFTALAAALTAACSDESDGTPPADLVFTNGYVYTVDAARSVAEAVAVRGNVIVHVGDNESVRGYIGGETDVRDLGGRMLLPGFHDAHVHATGLAEPALCNLEGRAMPPEELAAFLKGCITSGGIADGEWLVAVGWSGDTAPGEKYSTLRAVLDAASTAHPIAIWSSHSGAFNSAAFALAKNAAGEVVGMNARTLPGVFAEYRGMVSVDAAGEPSGKVVEGARNLIRDTVFEDVMGLNQPEAHTMPQAAAVLNRSGITSIQDPMAVARTLEFYDWFEKSGRMSFRVKAYLYDKVHTTAEVDAQKALAGIPRIVKSFDAMRKKYGGSDLFRVSGVKFFMDGGLSGAVHALPEPSTLPSTGIIGEFKQPIFAATAGGEFALRGYVNLDGDACKMARAHPEQYRDAAAASRFIGAHGHHPEQCAKSSGRLGHRAEYVHEYVRQMTGAGWDIHVHAESDLSMRVLADAFEASKELADANGVTQAIAHANLVHPRDQKRLGDLGVYIAPTYAWAMPFDEFMQRMIPFYEELDDIKDMYNPKRYFVKNLFPVKSLKAAGAHLAWGSDSPQGKRDPMLFFNIMAALTRGFDGNFVNTAERLDIHAVLESMTIASARLMDHADRVGSIEEGKFADLVVVDRNLVALAEQGNFAQIGEAKVDLTVFDGGVVFERAEK